MAQAVTEAHSSRVMSYDGFISYSHAADGLLAPRLQSGLQRFAKPWWKRRAVRIFRDESSLSANPHLWSSITEALDASGWFVLLLSPDAADSEWVNQEIAYWVENRDPKRILPVVTGGEFGWAGGDVAGDAVPGALRGAFREEPRWVDLRFAKDGDQLDLKDPRFADAIADIASTIRGIPKDDLASEEVRQHRRTIRTSWAAGGALLVLALSTTGVAIFAFGQQAEANRQRDIAQANEGRALASEQRALDEAANASARRLLALATAALPSDTHLAVLLGLEAYELAPSGEAREDVLDLLREATIDNRLIGRIEVSKGVNRVRISPDGSVLYHASTVDSRVSALDLETAAVLWKRDYVLKPTQIAIAPDGSHVAVALEEQDGQTSHVEVLDATTGSTVAVLESGSSCADIGLPFGGFSSDGRWLSLRVGGDNCDNSLAEDDWAVVLDSRDWDEFRRFDVEGAYDERLAISESRNLALGTYDERRAEGGSWAEVLTFPDLDLVDRFPIDQGQSVAFVRDTVVYDIAGEAGYELSVRIRRLASGDEISVPLQGLLSGFEYFERQGECERQDTCFEFEMFSISPDGTSVSVIGAGRDAVVDLADGSVALRLYDDGVTFDASWTADGATLVTAHESQLLVWAIVRDGRRLEEVVRSGDWVGFARSQLVRGFETGECVVYDIDPCPSLDDMRSR